MTRILKGRNLELDSIKNLSEESSPASDLSIPAQSQNGEPVRVPITEFGGSSSIPKNLKAGLNYNRIIFAEDFNYSDGDLPDGWTTWEGGLEIDKKTVALATGESIGIVVQNIPVDNSLGISSYLNSSHNRKITSYLSNGGNGGVRRAGIIVGKNANDYFLIANALLTIRLYHVVSGTPSDLGGISLATSGYLNRGLTKVEVICYYGQSLITLIVNGIYSEIDTASGLTADHTFIGMYSESSGGRIADLKVEQLF